MNTSQFQKINNLSCGKYETYSILTCFRDKARITQTFFFLIYPGFSVLRVNDVILNEIMAQTWTILWKTIIPIVHNKFLSG